MKRTQIQLPDWLFAAAKEVADAKEISLAELVRRGLEYMVATTPGVESEEDEWQLPQPHDLGSQDPFTAPNWREALHTDRLRVVEDRERDDAGSQP
jgi:hypothetical protein